MSEVNFLTSKRGKRILNYEDYLYYYHRSKGKNSYWYCIQNAAKHCKSRVRLEGSNVVQPYNGDHNHEPENKKITVLKFRTEMKNLAEEKNETPLPQLYRENLSKYAESVENASLLPTYDTIRTSLYNHRSKKLSTTPLSQESTTKSLQQESTTTCLSKESTTKLLSQESTTMPLSQQPSTSQTLKVSVLSPLSQESTTTALFQESAAPPSPQRSPTPPSPHGSITPPSLQESTYMPSPQGSTTSPSPQGSPTSPSPQVSTALLSTQGLTNLLSPLGSITVVSSQGSTTSSLPQESANSSLPQGSTTSSLPLQRLNQIATSMPLPESFTTERWPQRLAPNPAIQVFTPTLLPQTFTNTQFPETFSATLIPQNFTTAPLSFNFMTTPLPQMPTIAPPPPPELTLRPFPKKPNTTQSPQELTTKPLPKSFTEMLLPQNSSTTSVPQRFINKPLPQSFTKLLSSQSSDDSRGCEDTVTMNDGESEGKPRRKSKGRRRRVPYSEKMEKQKKRDSELTGRRIVDIASFIKQIQDISVHENSSCSFKDMAFVSEVQRGFNSALIFKCQVCSLEKTLWTNPGLVDAVNRDAVAGMEEAGGGYGGLQLFTAELSIPCMSSSNYSKVRGKLNLTKMDDDAAEVKEGCGDREPNPRMIKRTYGEKLEALLSNMNKTKETQPEIANTKPQYVELEPITLLVPVEPSDLIVKPDPKSIITSGMDPPDTSVPIPSSRVEPDTSMMELDQAMTCEIYPAHDPPPDILPKIKIKKEPIDLDLYRQDILSASVEQEMSRSSNESSMQDGSLFQPPALIKEEAVSSEEEL